MSERRYAFCYALIGDTSNGRCVGVTDSTNYELDPTYVPIEQYDVGYVMNYYWPLPEIVTSHDDFVGQWYKDAAHTEIFEI